MEVSLGSYLWKLLGEVSYGSYLGKLLMEVTFVSGGLPQLRQKRNIVHAQII